MAVAQRTLIAERTAEVVWAGRLANGGGTVTADSGAFRQLPVTWAARTQQPGGKTSPEELAAAAHASCFSMAFALRLGEHGAEAQRLDISATVSLDDVEGRPTIVSSALKMSASVPGIDESTFRQVVDEAAELCPISRLFAGAKITVDATLEGR